MKHILTFWSLKLYVSLFAVTKSFFGNPWKNVQGILLPLSGNIGFSTLRWIVNGEYEQGELKLVRDNLVPNDVVMEIGTGLGFLSVYCAKQIGNDKVFSFEANPLNIAVAKDVFRKNNVSPHLQNALLAAETGFVAFPVDRKNRLASSLQKSSKDIIHVPRLSLNKTIAEIQPTFLLMDIEGAEYDIFKQIDFQTITKIQVELHPSILGREKMKEIFQILSCEGFIKVTELPDGRNYFFKK